MDPFTIILWIITLTWFFISIKKDKDKTLSSIKSSSGMMRNLGGQIISILFLIGLILTFLPPETIERYLGQSNVVISSIVSTLVGSITLIPAFVAFLTTLTMVGLVTFSLEQKEFGTKFTIARNSLSFIFAIAMPSKAIESVKNSSYYIKEMIMTVILILTSLIETWVPKESIQKALGKNSGPKGAFFSFLLGSFSAGPIYAAFPLCKMLFNKGTSINNLVIILSTWAVVKVPMFANEAKFLGPKFMVIRWILTTISIFIMAYVLLLFNLNYFLELVIHYRHTNFYIFST